MCVTPPTRSLLQAQADAERLRHQNKLKAQQLLSRIKMQLSSEVASVRPTKQLRDEANK